MQNSEDTVWRTLSSHNSTILKHRVLKCFQLFFVSRHLRIWPTYKRMADMLLSHWYKIYGSQLRQASRICIYAEVEAVWLFWTSEMVTPVSPYLWELEERNGGGVHCLYIHELELCQLGRNSNVTNPDQAFKSIRNWSHRSIRIQAVGINPIINRRHVYTARAYL